MARKIVITSGKGGVGKTTVTANLGIALSKLGKKVALIDVDFGLNNLDVVLGMENQVVFDVLDVLEGRCRPKQALIEHKNYKNLYILPSDKVNSHALINGQNVKLVIESIINSFDYVILDCPAGIDVGFHRAISAVDEAMVVITPNLSSIRDASKVLSILKSYRLDKINLIVNMARWDLIASKKELHPLEIKNVLKTDLIGVLPDEDAIFLSSGRKLPVSSDSYKAYKVLADNLEFKKQKIYDKTVRYSGLIGSIRRGIKSNI